MSTDSPLPTRAFADRWRALPNELKFEVISHLVPNNQDLDIDILTETARQQKKCLETDSTDVPLLWCLLEHAEFHELATMALFKNNKFVIDAVEVDCREYELEYPAASMVKHITRLQLMVGVDFRDWNWMARCMEGLHAFENVCELDLVVVGSCPCRKCQYDFDEAVANERVVVDVKQLRVRYQAPEIEELDPERITALMALVMEQVMTLEDAEARGLL
ncbi:hypothetical protein CC86DRAFT_456669 [Ophiobolus disseminans]|uniref:Uncharacterized protein n=1 Tax=Ophiobolus disseminans TaxID=1469910 RepID=A0A6A6ZUX1_9PLEO|nr:hypothetical protein CC86DRAFT_456669 [Ophiobolus disseminans]